MSIDVIGDFLTIIRNAIAVRKKIADVPFSKMKMGIAEVLMNEGFIRDFKKIEGDDGKTTLRITLKYVNGESAINEITRISTPGRRRYEGVREITPVAGGLGVSILTTSSGIMTAKKAQSMSIGGEVICHIW